MTEAEETALRALSDDPNLKRLEASMGEFNLFGVLQIGHLELQHSWLIAWLLDPRGSHGLGDAFLCAFLSQATAMAEERGIPVPSPNGGADWQFSDVEVARERHYIDILVLSQADELACIIENKIFSNEIPGQLRWYFETVKTTYPALRPFPIFLTPDGRKPLEARDQADYVPFGYEQVADIIDEALQTHDSDVSAPVFILLEQYTKTLRRFILTTPSDIDELAFRLYVEHRDAVDRIAKAYNSSVGYGWDVLDEAMRTLEPHMQPDTHTMPYHRFSAEPLDEIAELKMGDGWTPSKRIVLFQIEREGTNRQLRLWIGPGAEDIRGRVYEVAQNKGLPFLKSKQASPFYYHWIYEKTLLTDSDLLNREEAKKVAQKAVDEFFEQDFWPLVNGIREEFGLPPASREAT